MIPGNITEKHILQAIADVDCNGVPKGRGSTRYNLQHDGRFYPPKYIVSLANKFANGLELPSAQFNGGREVNEFLAKLGFSIEGSYADQPRISETQPSIHQPAQPRIHRPTQRHDERCSDCKNTLIEMFRHIYDSVKIDHKIQAPARIEDYADRPCYSDLKRVFQSLQEHRGHREFIRLNLLHRCDLYIPSIDTVVEFDESQHFTAARDVALAHYPPNLQLGFDLKKWRDRCKSINAKDNDPEFRDEQRAWYDSLRDFLPFIEKMSSTIRIYMGEFRWCSLDPHNPADVAKFRKLLSPFLPVNPAIADNGIFVSTVVIASQGTYTNDSRLELMRNVLLGTAAATIDIFLFPAGFIVTKDTPSTQINMIVDQIREIVRSTNRKSIVCFGIDGRDSKDQVAAAVGVDGLLGLARKFYPTQMEADLIDVAPGPFTGEGNFPRIIEVAGKKVYLAVCYDGFGIRHRNLSNPGVDLVVDLAHGFNPKGDGNSGDVYFAKHGLAGASKQWQCPAFGAAVFFNRSIPNTWPTGVVWNQGSKSTQNWQYSDNPLYPLNDFEVSSGSERAMIRMYHV